MSAKQKTIEAVPAPTHAPAYVARWGRGRIGGTGTLMLLGQRAKAQGRPVQFLDGDLKSGTLSAFYGSECSRPPSLDDADFRKWVLDDLDQMEQDRCSRLLDVSGGSSSMEVLLRDMELPEFCIANDMRFTWLCMLGPDAEDWEHVRSAVAAGHLRPEHMLFVLNEGAVRRGQNAIGAFEGVTRSADFAEMVRQGAQAIMLNRLSVMDELRSGKWDFYGVASRTPNAAGERPRATWAHMVGKWLGDVEAELVQAKVEHWVP